MQTEPLAERFGAASMWGRLLRVLVRPPLPGDAAAWRAYGWRAAPDPLAAAEHIALLWEKEHSITPEQKNLKAGAGSGTGAAGGAGPGAGTGGGGKKTLADLNTRIRDLHKGLDKSSDISKLSGVLEETMRELEGLAQG